MPNLFTFRGYVIYFWAGDGNEPLHVHVSLGAPSPVSAKFWLTKDGRAILANNAPNFGKKDIRQLTKIIQINHKRICDQWEDMFGRSPEFFNYDEA